MKIFENKNHYRKGFGLLEVLISAVIIIMILAALVFIGRAALSNNEYLSERAQAVYVAQEGLELTRQIRDTNWIDGDNTTKWDTLDSIPPIAVNPDRSLYYNNAHKRIFLTELPIGSNPPINLNGVLYSRVINVAPVDPAGTLLPNGAGTDLKPYALKVTVTVTWTFSGQSKTITVSEILTNWRPDF